MGKSPLPLLIRRARFDVDERRAELAELVRQEEKAALALRAHDAKALQEQEGLNNTEDAAGRLAFPGWLRQHLRERDRLADLYGKLQRSRDIAQDALQEAVAELKRLELAEEDRQTSLKKAAAKRAEAKAEDVEMIRRAADRK